MVAVQRFNPFHGSVIFSARCPSNMTSLSLSPVVRTPSSNSRRQNGIQETPEAGILRANNSADRNGLMRKDFLILCSCNQTES